MAERIRNAGDGALLAELGEPAPAVAARARAVAQAIREERWPGVHDVLPAYCTVLVAFDPCTAGADGYADRLAQLLHSGTSPAQRTARVVELPVHYGDEDGPDLADVARLTGLAIDEVIHLHSSTLYTVEFLGFSPGFPYLSGLPAALATPRLPSPRLRVPAGSVGIGGAQTGVYPLASPGGWRLIGRTTAIHFDPARPETLPYGPGDTIRFLPVAAPPLPVPAETGTLRQTIPVARGLRVLRAGPLATIQDRGRFGWAALGYGTGGAMDREAALLANRLVGNDAEAAVLELTLDGGEFEAIGDLTIAVTGGDLAPAVDGEPIPCWHACPVRTGSRLRFGTRRSGLRAYLAVAGGIAVQPVLSSRATDLIAQLGGMQGRTLRTGDLLPVAPATSQTGWRLPTAAVPRAQRAPTVRVIWGPQDDWFAPEARARFVSQPFTVSPRGDRTGIRLEGTPLIPLAHGDLPSEGQGAGAIQVPPNGEPIVLMADGRSVGGYPKIATVISADMHLLAQAAGGSEVRFQAVTAADARAAAREQRARLQTLSLAPAPETEVRCLLEYHRSPGWRCPRSLLCLVGRRCLAMHPTGQEGT